jgi:hypothetical protein
MANLADMIEDETVEVKKIKDAETALIHLLQCELGLTPVEALITVSEFVANMCIAHHENTDAFVEVLRDTHQDRIKNSN